MKFTLHPIMIYLVLTIHTAQTEEVVAFPKDPTSVEISFSGTMYDNRIQNATQIESMAKYKLLAQQGTILFNASPYDIDKWYDFISRPRSYPVEYTVYQKGSYVRKSIFCPAGTRKYYESFEEYIIRDECLFYIAHPFKNIQLSDSGHIAQESYLYLFNPLDLLITKPTQSSKNYSIKNSITTQDVESWSDIKPYQLNHKISKTKNLNDLLFPKKAVLIMEDTTNNNLRYIWVVETTGNSVVNGYSLPEKIQITFYYQSITKEDHELNLNGVKYLSGKKNVQFDTIEIDSDDNFRRKWDLSIQYISFENLSDDLFWPEVPEGYSYKDGRTRNFDLLRSSSITNDEKKILEGKGPYIFPR